MEKELKEDNSPDIFEEDDPDVKKLKRKRKRRVKKKRLKDIRKALLGNLVLTDDNKLTPGGDFRITLWGAPDGAFGTILLGISEKSVKYKYKSKNDRQALYKVEEAMKNIGRGIVFETVENGCACLLKHLFFRPVVLVFEKTDEDEELMLRAYCGRDILTFSSIKRAIKLFDQEKPKGLEPVEERSKTEDGEGNEDENGKGIKSVLTGVMDKLKKGGNV